MKLAVALYQPEIPPNTGNIIRLCANTNTALHLIHPMSFTLDDKHCRRAGLDYHEYARVQEHVNYEAFRATIGPARLIVCSTKATQSYDQMRYQPGDIFLFGQETRGLPPAIQSAIPPEHAVRIPMQSNSRSLNLSNACAVILYEAWRQLNFQF
jgi:tRNA (cytidine/uridine-2'-O-)-methyltransferase